MLVVRAYHSLGEPEGSLLLPVIREVCVEVVPAALHVPSAPLFPDSIYFIDGGRQDIPVKVFLDIEAKLNEHLDADEAKRQLVEALHRLMPKIAFGVCIKLCLISWHSDRPQPRPKGLDMSMAAAISRVLIQRQGRTDGSPMCWECGNEMLRTGSAYVCISCGTVKEKGQ